MTGGSVGILRCNSSFRFRCFFCSVFFESLISKRTGSSCKVLISISFLGLSCLIFTNFFQLGSISNQDKTLPRC